MMISFYCENCGKDLDLPAHREKKSWGEYWIARCPHCGKMLGRNITNVREDPYYQKSKRVRRLAKALKKDLLQYGEDGFQLHYPEQWKRMEKNAEMMYNKEKEKIRQRNEFYERHRHNNKNLAKKVIEKEEQLENARRK